MTLNQQNRQRRDFETLLVEEGERPFFAEYESPIARVFDRIDAENRAYRVPVRPWVIGECCDHVYPTCPHVVRTGRLDANDGNWRAGRYETVDDPNNVMYLHPDEDPWPDVCGWCYRVWRARYLKAVS